jgi:hypothetical protein
MTEDVSRTRTVQYFSVDPVLLAAIGQLYEIQAAIGGFISDKLLSLAKSTLNSTSLNKESLGK